MWVPSSREAKKGGTVSMLSREVTWDRRGEEEIVAAGFGRLAIEASVVFRGERRQMGEEIVCHGLLVACGGSQCPPTRALVKEIHSR